MVNLASKYNKEYSHLHTDFCLPVCVSVYLPLCLSLSLTYTLTHMLSLPRKGLSKAIDIDPFRTLALEAPRAVV